MKTLPRHLTPDIWLQQVFTSTEARKGGVVKRKIRDVERLVGRHAFLHEVERRGFQAVENHQHYVVFCNTLPLRRAKP
ncbi:N-(5'-phosphoribosyl)anthranilate isomerase [Roseovarius sp. MMSF_3281]|uniref:N-(5'-phosphoribosyl)anthranilate isomerase n=1 Tax=Roseovarius sp. MMSF_3281 TaxID=3046694 RepID=UPI00273D2008|nr:N-(5'-phosphoribosyl)anthranilate isomerase [Roseovarius sp. MMSF_3281]